MMCVSWFVVVVVVVVGGVVGGGGGITCIVRTTIKHLWQDQTLQM